LYTKKLNIAKEVAQFHVLWTKKVKTQGLQQNKDANIFARAAV